MTLSKYKVSYHIVGNSRRHRVLEIKTVGKLTKKTALRCVSEVSNVPQDAVKIIEIKEA